MKKLEGPGNLKLEKIGGRFKLLGTTQQTLFQKEFYSLLIQYERPRRSAFACSTPPPETRFFKKKI